MLTKEVVVDQMTILEDGKILVRKATRIFEDGIKISETFHRHIVSPNTLDLSKEHEKVKAVANVLWTKEVKDKFNKN